MKVKTEGQLAVLIGIEEMRAKLDSNKTNLEMMQVCDQLAARYMLIDTETLIEALLKAEGINASKKAS